MAGLAACLAVAAGGGWFLLADGSQEAKLPVGQEPTTSHGSREERLATMLEGLATGLGSGSTGALAAPSGAEQLAAVDANIRKIGFSTLALRYVAPAEQTGAGIAAPGTWVADVQLTWQFRRYDAAQSSLEVPMVVVDDGRATRFVGFATPQGSERIPLWLLEPLAVDKSPRTLVLAADRSRLPVLTKLARTAVPAVDEVLPSWGGALVLAEPSSQERLNEAVGADATATSQLAGVTTTVDGAVTRGATNHVLLNPKVFDGLGPQAAQIVVTHEATHVATDGAVSSMPQWLVEGFADYVALRDAGVPISVSAGQVIGQVRRDGAPQELPTGSEFGGDDGRLGATYESAWLACRLIADQYGERRLVAFYRASDEASATAGAFRSVLGVTEAEFTRSWISHLTDLASAS